MTKTGGTEKKYCVIGAGAAGLAAVQALVREGLEVDCFEKTDRVGGHWNWDYDSLHLITSSGVTGFPEFPMPADWPMFPSRKRMVAYLNSYADRFGLREKITFNMPVTSVQPADGPGPTGAAGWRVTAQNGTSRHYDGVFVANGHLWDQRIPQIASRFDGKQIHSGSYRNAGDIDGETVLVVGCGNSGCDLAVDAAQAGLRSHIVIRRGHYFQPKTFFGKPRSELDFMQAFSPQEQDTITRLMMRLSVGTYADYPGLPAPQHETLAEGPPIVNELLLYWIRHGRITVHPDIENFKGNTAWFTDGTSLPVDTVLWATGFNVSFPFLKSSLFSWQDGVPLKAGASIFPVGLEKLYFVGLIAPRGPQPPVYSLQSKLAVDAALLHRSADDGWRPVAGHMSATQQAEAEIDVLRHLWLAGYEETSASLEQLRQNQPALS